MQIFNAPHFSKVLEKCFENIILGIFTDWDLNVPFGSSYCSILVENEENVKRDFQLLCYKIQLAVLENKLFVSYFLAKSVSFSPIIWS